MPVINNIQLRTSVRIQQRVSDRNPGDIADTVRWIDIGNDSESDPPRHKRCQWIGAHGSEAFEDEALQGTLLATIRLRYDDRITETCRVVRGDDLWEIISVDDVRQYHRWMEIKLKRKAAG